MMPPSTGLPVESSARRSPFASSDTGRDAYEPAPPATPDTTTGMSSEEPGEAALGAANGSYDPPRPTNPHPTAATPP